MNRDSAIIRGNALDLPLADSSVDLIVTSPPYFGLRSYQDDGEHYEGQIGSEATPAEFVDALLAATREMVRVLKPSGSLWVNLGDKYVSNPGSPELGANTIATRKPRTNRSGQSGTLRPKSLIGIPWRYAIACIDQLGLILRAEVIWSKPNGLPESVTDRVRRSHETWFHLVRSPRYFSAVDEIREEHLATGKATPGKPGWKMERGETDRAYRQNGWTPETAHPLGKLPGSVWTIPTQPLTVPPELGVDHFAAFPMEWPRRIIQGWSPSGVCTGCGEGRRPVVDRPGGSWHDHDADGQGHNQNGRERKQRYNERIANGQMPRFLGYECACGKGEAAPAGSPVRSELLQSDAAVSNDRLPRTTPAVILDPFGGTGTVALVAKALGRHGISLDMSADYCRLATWRTSDEGELARALQVDKPAKQVDGQLSLLDTP